VLNRMVGSLLHDIQRPEVSGGLTMVSPPGVI
jgi:hypothetical protein